MGWSTTLWVRCAVALALVAVPLSIPGLQTTSFGGWPAVGFATVFMVLVGRGRARWIGLGVLTLVVAPLLAASYDVALPLALLGSTAVSLPALLTSWLLPSADGRLLVSQPTMVRYHVVTALSGVVCALFGTLTVLGIQTPHQVLLTGLMSFLAGLTAQLLVLPLVVRTPTSLRAQGLPVELALQRVSMAVAVVVVFASHTTVDVAFIAFPLLAWGALRASRVEAHVQLCAVGLVAYGFTFAGRGPLVPHASGVPHDYAPALLYLFVAAAAYLTFPLALTVQQLLTVTDAATSAASTVERMLDSATGSVIIATDAIGRITHYNAGAQATLGYTLDEVVGRSPAIFHTPEEIARQAHFFGVPEDHTQVSLAMARTETKRDWEFVHKDGTRRMTSLNLSELRDASGRVSGYIATGEDITDRLRTEQALRAALDREHASVMRLQEVDHVKQELVSNVSHELRTPITSISGYTELLAEGDLGELNQMQVDAVTRIERNTARLGLLVEDLLTLSRAEAGELEFEGAPVDLRSIARESYDLVEELVRQRSLDVRVDLPDSPVVVHADAIALERVATNLLSNALKFTPDGGTVTLDVRVVGGEAVLEVRDSGIGIPEEDQQHLFTRFFRAQGATERAIQGTGLGLSIVHAIVTRHSGRVTVRSTPGVGTTVTVTLPLLTR